MAEIAVVIPVYNAERTLARAVESVLNQNFRDVEVVVVDDGSTDGTLDVALRLSARDARVRVLHQDNARAYAARLAGLRHSNSHYVTFVDADDAVRPEIYEKMLAVAREHDLDVVQCEPRGSDRRPDGVELLLGRDRVLERFVRPQLLEGRDACFVWDKLYDRRCLSVDFERSNILMGDDLKFNLQVFTAVSRMGILHEGLYEYNIGGGSSVRNFHPQSISDLREQIGTRRHWLPRYGFAADDPSMDAWILKNVRIYVSRAITAPAPDGRTRRENVRALLAIPELREALSRRSGWSADAVFLTAAAFLPLPLFVNAVRLLKCLLNVKRGFG